MEASSGHRPEIWKNLLPVPFLITHSDGKYRLSVWVWLRVMWFFGKFGHSTHKVQGKAPRILQNKSLTAKALRKCDHHFLWTLPSALAFLSNVQSFLLNTHEKYRLLFPYFGSRLLKAMRPANFCFRSMCANTALPTTPQVWRLSHLSSCWRAKSKWIWINSHIHASACASSMTSIIFHL